METKAEQKVFEYKHPVSGDVFTYEDSKHAYKLNGIALPGTTTPLELVNELSWDKSGKMTSKSQIIQMWMTKKITTSIKEQLLDLIAKGEVLTDAKIDDIIKMAKSKPKESFEGAGVSGTAIHAKIEEIIKDAIINFKGIIPDYTHADMTQVQNFVNWAVKNKVRFLFSEEPIYSKEWMNCGTVDFICEIDGKVLIGDIKTNGDKRRYEWDSVKNRYDFSKPVSDIHITALWQTGCYGKMATEPEARKLIEKFDGVVVVNIKKSGDFDESLDVRYDYNVESLVDAFQHVIGLYKCYRGKV